MKFFIFLLLPKLFFAQSGFDIAKMVDNRSSPSSLISYVKMKLENSKGKIREHTMISKSIDRNKKQIIWFLEPKDDRGIAFLKIEHDGKDDEMRMWLPAFKKIRRISAKKKGDSFMGSDLSYEDLSNRGLESSEYRRLEDETISGINCYVIESIPKTNVQSSYLRHISWIDKNKFTLVKEHSFDKNGILEKKKEFNYIKIEDYYIIEEVFVSNILKQHTTMILFSDIKVDSELSTNFFHEKNLKRLPIY